MTKGKRVSFLKKAAKQIEEDRSTILDLYSDLKGRIVDLDEYALHGPTLGKFAELLIKQSAQTLELAKMTTNKKEGAEFSFDEEDASELYEEMGKIKVLK